MVEINYCPRCKKADRAHLVKRGLCRRCLEEYKTINVSRSKYFIIQLPLLMMGVAFIIYTIYLFINDPRKIAEVFGNLLMAIAFFLFALGFQFMDSKAMEEEAVEIGRHKYSSDDDKEDPLIFKRRRSIITGMPVKSRSARSRELLLRGPLNVEPEEEEKKVSRPRPRSTDTSIQRSLTSFESPNSPLNKHQKSKPRKIRKPL
jgi:hypothetical protein